jgi:hypothetical protein
LNKTSTLILLRKFLALGALTAALFVVSYTKVTTSTRAVVDSCEPCLNCTPDTICTPCGAHARPTDNFCEDGLRMYSCAGVCKPNGGNSCIGDVPICEGTAIAICNGGTWECDNAPWNQCTGSMPNCPNGAFCYGGEYYCANGNGCTGTPPDCDPSEVVYVPASCHSGNWYCP